MPEENYQLGSIMLSDDYHEEISLIPSETKVFFKNKKVLITGGLGMIGSNLSRILVIMGAEVTILDAMLPLYGGNIFNIFSIEDRVRLVVGDIRDQNLVEKFITETDIIFHLAAQVSYIDSMSDPLLDLDINCRGSLILLECCRRLNPKVKVVFAGSRMEYGRVIYNPVDEDHPTEPLMIYGVHKLTAEKYHIMYFHDYGVVTTVLRITNPYGPRQQMKHSKYGVINWFIRMAMTDQVIKIFGDGQQIRDYVYIMDVVNALLMAGANSKADGEVFNVGSGKGIRFKEMVEEVIKVVGKGTLETVPWPYNYQNIETGNFIADTGKIYRLLDWKARYDLTTGIQKTFEYYKAYRGHYWT